MFKRGDTFLMGPIDEYHLHVVVADPNSSGELVIAPITTLRPRTPDRLLILQPGDHPFVKHASAIACNFAQITTVSKLEELLASGRILPREAMEQSLVGRITAALIESDFTENGVKFFLKEGSRP